MRKWIKKDIINKKGDKMKIEKMKLANGRMIGDYINSKYERAIALKVLKENIKWLKEDAEADKRDVEVSVIDMHLKWQGGYGELVSVDRDDSVE